MDEERQKSKRKYFRQETVAVEQRKGFPPINYFFAKLAGLSVYVLDHIKNYNPQIQISSTL